MALALAGLPQIPDERVLVGHSTADDAGVFRISADRALVQTVDVLAPMVDDPYAFGRIAAVNSLSDVYAMGGEPLSALSVLGFPNGGDTSVMTEIIRGAQDAVVEAGAALLGGHTFAADEIRFGLAVTGEIHPDAIFTNAGAKPGDRLILTKPIGVGVVTSASVKYGALPAEILNPAIASMLTSNKIASRTMRRFPVHACTDVTGFGLVGHAAEMAVASGVGLTIESVKVPFLPGVRELLADGVRDGASARNRKSFESGVEAGGVDASVLELLYGSETSGGLLLATAPEVADQLLTELVQAGIPAAEVGSVRESPGKMILS